MLRLCGPFWGKPSGGRWILITKDQLYGKCVYVTASSCLDAGKNAVPGLMSIWATSGLLRFRGGISCKIRDYSDINIHRWFIAKWLKLNFLMMTSPNGNIFAFLALFEGNPPVTGGFLSKGLSLDVELWSFLWSAPEQTVEQIIESPVIWGAIPLIVTSLWCKNKIWFTS